MTGPEHYAEAERLLEAAKDDWRDATSDNVATAALVEGRVRVALLAASIHSSLAQSDALDTLAGAIADSVHGDRALQVRRLS